MVTARTAVRIAANNSARKRTLGRAKRSEKAPSAEDPAGTESTANAARRIDAPPMWSPLEAGRTQTIRDPRKPGSGLC